MQHPRPSSLRNHTRRKRRHRTPRAPKRTNHPHPIHPLRPRHPSHEYGRRARVNRPQQQPYNRDRHGGADDVGHQPHEELEDRRADGGEEHEELLADAVSRVREAEPADGDARPEAGRDVAHGFRVAVARRDEEGDDPARDGDFGALVGEDEEGAKEDDADFEGGEHAQELGGRVRCCCCGLGGGCRLGAAGGQVPLVVPKRVGRKHAVEDGEAEGDKVVRAPPRLRSRDERGGDQGSDGAAGPVGAVHEAECGGGVAEGAAEDVVHGEGDGHAEADEEEGDNDDGEGGLGEDGRVGDGDDGLGEGEEAGAAELEA